jgi:ribulose-phosphate 3-epimerase
MVVEPERYLEAFAEAGAEIITVHAEATVNLQSALRTIRRLGKRAGLALNPQTSETVLQYILDDIDLVLVMTINPGFAGQAFLPGVLPKVAKVYKLTENAGHEIDVEVDGAISPSTAHRVASAGANILVAGSAIYGKPDRRRAIRDIRASAQGAASACDG